MLSFLLFLIYFKQLSEITENFPFSFQCLQQTVATNNFLFLFSSSSQPYQSCKLPFESPILTIF